MDSTRSTIRCWGRGRTPASLLRRVGSLLQRRANGDDMPPASVVSVARRLAVVCSRAQAQPANLLCRSTDELPFSPALFAFWFPPREHRKRQKEDEQRSHRSWQHTTTPPGTNIHATWTSPTYIQPGTACMHVERKQCFHNTRGTWPCVSCPSCRNDSHSLNPHLVFPSLWPGIVMVTVMVIAGQAGSWRRIQQTKRRPAPVLDRYDPIKSPRPARRPDSETHLCR